jgi:site-specific recombinase XerD
LGYFLKTDMPIAAIERTHVAGFWIWLKKKGLSQDYCNKLVQPCIGLFLFAIREGYIDRSPFAGIRLEWKKDFDTTCLSHGEIELITNKDWSDKLQRVADLFLFMCYTGLHISDYQSIEETDRYIFQGTEFMRVKRFKTKVVAMFPLDPEALRIIEKYNGISNLPKISGQKSNDYLKLIAEGVGIEKNLTNKVARKTFTDRCLNDHGFSDEVVAVMLGHTSTRQLKHYGTIKERRILNEWKNKALPTL